MDNLNLLYNQSVQYGKFVTNIELIMMAFFVLMFFIWGLVYIFENDYIKVHAKIISPIDDSMIDPLDKTIDVAIQYDINKHSYHNTINIPYNKYVKQNALIEIFVDEKNPTKNIELVHINKKYIGYILLIISFIILLSGLYMWYIVSKYDVAAFGIGLSNAFNF